MRRTSATHAGTDHVSLDRAGHCISLSWVLDGAVSPDSREGPARFVDGLERELERIGRGLGAHDDGTSLADILESAIEANPERDSGHSAAVALSRHTAEGTRLLVLGDSVATAFRSGAQGEPVPVLLSDRRLEDIAVRERELLRTACRSGADVETLHQLKVSLFAEETSRRNRLGGYWVAASEPSAAGNARTALLPPGSPVCLTTAGVPGPFGIAAATLFEATSNAELGQALTRLRAEMIGDGAGAMGDMAAAVASPHRWDPREWMFQTG